MPEKGRHEREKKLNRTMLESIQHWTKTELRRQSRGKEAIRVLCKDKTNGGSLLVRIVVAPVC